MSRKKNDDTAKIIGTCAIACFMSLQSNWQKNTCALSPLAKALFEVWNKGYYLLLWNLWLRSVWTWKDFVIMHIGYKGSESVAYVMWGSLDLTVVYFQRSILKQFSCIIKVTQQWKRA